jgi:hypothetical protein
MATPASERPEKIEASVTKEEPNSNYRIRFIFIEDQRLKDEVRYDSCEIKGGRKTLSPHLHINSTTPVSP